MSVATVKAHVSRLLTKLGVDNRVQIAILIHDEASGFDGQNSTTLKRVTCASKPGRSRSTLLERPVQSGRLVNR
jgi:hypothetical protein